MQEEENQLILFVIVIATILFLILVVSVILSVIAYKRSRIRHLMEIKEKENQYREEILKAKLEVKEQTLRSISGELHDNIGQVLSLVKLNLATMSSNPEKAAQKLSDTRELVKTLSEDLRQLSRLLHPDYADLSLADVLQNELQQLEQTGAYQTSFVEKGSAEKLTPNTHILIFRMIQEILNNIIKHANASKVAVVLESNKHQSKITIEDNGIGFDVATFKQQGMGLKNLKHRAALLGATIRLESTPGSGTRVILNLLL